MILKKQLFKSSIAILIFTLFNLNFGSAQFQIEDSSNFQLVYNSLIESEVDRAEYSFVGNYIIKEWIGPGITKVFKEPILQIIDLTDWTFYEYFPESKRINETNRPTELHSYPNEVMNQKDSTLDGNNFIYFLVKRNFTVDGNLAFYDVLFFKDFKLPNKYKIISEIYRGKNTYFPTYHSGVIFHIVSTTNMKKGIDMQLESVSESKYNEEEIQDWLSNVK